MKKVLGVLLMLLMVVSSFAGERIILATTTSVRDSGLMDFILPMYEKESGNSVDMIAVGTGKALQMGRDGEADVLLVHAKASELKFMANGHGKDRTEVFHNYFVIVGPKDGKKMGSVEEVLKIASENGVKFASRGDNSGTNKKELQLWDEVGVKPSDDSYVVSGNGMGATLKVADEMEAYTLSDIATYLNLADKLDLEIKVGEDSSLLNQYGVITIEPSKNKQINYAGAKSFAEWLATDRVKDIVESFGVDRFGMSLFVPER